MYRINILILFVCLSTSSVFTQDIGEVLIFKDKKYNHKTIIPKQQMAKSQKDSVLFLSDESRKVVHQFNTVLFNGKCSDTNWILEIRFMKGDKTWSHWAKAKTKFFKTGRFWAKFQLFPETTDKIRYRIINRGVKGKFVVDIFTIEVFDDRVKMQKPQKAIAAPEYKFYTSIDSFPRPDIISRDEWGAVSPTGTLIPHVPYRMTLHHTAWQRVQTLE